jgi:hypothetical protein
MANEWPVDPLPVEAFEEASRLVRRAREFSANLSAAATGQRITAGEMARFADKAQGTLDRLAVLAAVPRVADEAKRQWGDSEANVGLVFQRIAAALTDAKGALEALAEPPVDPSDPLIADAIAKLDAVVAATKTG